MSSPDEFLVFLRTVVCMYVVRRDTNTTIETFLLISFACFFLEKKTVSRLCRYVKPTNFLGAKGHSTQTRVAKRMPTFQVKNSGHCSSYSAFLPFSCFSLPILLFLPHPSSPRSGPG